MDCYRSYLAHRNYLAHSLFSPVMECFVSILRIHCFLLYRIFTLLSCAFLVFSCNRLLRQYSRILSFLFCNIFQKYLAHSQLPPTILYKKYFSILMSWEKCSFHVIQCTREVKEGTSFIVNVAKIMIRPPNFSGDSISWKKKTKKQQTIK